MGALRTVQTGVRPAAQTTRSLSIPGRTVGDYFAPRAKYNHMRRLKAGQAALDHLKVKELA